MSQVSQILNAIETGDTKAAAQLLPLVYEELRRCAAALLSNEKPGQTLDATALVHEAWLRLVPDAKSQAAWHSRRHFFAAAAEAMRRILVEKARRKRRIKHGGGMRRQPLAADVSVSLNCDDDLIALDEALSKFTARYPVHARLVELRYFAGLTGDEAASMLEISSRTADRHWVFARAWLRRQLKAGQDRENS